MFVGIKTSIVVFVHTDCANVCVRFVVIIIIGTKIALILLCF